MQKTQHPSNTRVLGAPKGWDNSPTSALPCGALAITDSTIEGYAAIDSYWKPTPIELIHLQAGASIKLTILSQTMPPVMLQVEP